MNRSLSSLSLAASLVAAALAPLVACSEPAPNQTNAQPVTAPPSDAGAAAPKDAETASEPVETPDAGYTGPRIGALYMVTPILSDMEWPRSDDDTAKKHGDDARDKVVRLGYLRHGSRAPVIPEAHKKPNCTEGWYELVAGGFVCGKYATLDMNHPRIKSGPHPPNLEDALPYQYGYNVGNGTPLYRQVPSRDERIQLEPWLVKKKAPPKRDDETTQNDQADASIELASNRVTEDPLDAGTPWYLRDFDGGKPQVTLDDLRGEGPIARRMVKGFYLALDKDFTAGGSRWWKTTGGLIAPFDRIYVQKPLTDFHGIWLNETAKTPSPVPEGGVAPADWDPKAGVAFVLWWHAHKYIVSPAQKKYTTGDSVARFTPAKLTGQSVTIGGGTFIETVDHWWMKTNEGVVTKPGAPPPDLEAGEKWIDVNLTSQTLLAFEGDKPVYATLISSGKRDFVDKEKDHQTPSGSFRIREKHVAATMDGDVAADGPYSIEDVPWIMYFKGSYALHGAFWHANFGHVQSHGCVNLAPLDAKTMFFWTEPKLPEGWHGVNATAEKPGTRVVVHE